MQLSSIAALFLLAAILIAGFASSSLVMAQQMGATTTTTTPASSSGLELSPEPVLRERQITISQTPINQTHILFTDSGNGTITLPNTTETINFTGTDSVVVSTVDGTAVGKEVFTTLDGSETVNGTVFAMARFNMEEGTGRAIVLLLLQTNSTGRLAPVDGMILAGHIEFYPDGSAESTMWEWQSGVPLLQQPSTPAQDSPPPMETPTATDATADDTVETPPTTQQSSPMQQQTQQPINHGASVFIVQGSSILTTDTYLPNSIQVSIGDTVTWINDDVYAHTVTSGSNGVLDHKFNSSPNYDPLIPPGATFSHTFTEVGEYPYFCLLHSNMVGTVSVTDFSYFSVKGAINAET